MVWFSPSLTGRPEAGIYGRRIFAKPQRMERVIRELEFF